MTLPVPPIEELLYDADLWSVDPSGAFIATVICDSGDDDTYRVYEEDMAQLHPQFPDAVRCLVSWGTDGIKGRLVAATLDYYRDNIIKIKSKQGHEYIFREISEMYEIEPQHPLIRIQGQTLRMETAGAAFNHVLCVGQTPSTSIAFSRESLQKQYPGWEQRWSVAKELGLERDALSKYVFSNTTPTLACDVMSQVGFE